MKLLLDQHEEQTKSDWSLWPAEFIVIAGGRFSLSSGPPPTDLAFVSPLDSSFWEHRVISGPLQERVGILLRNSGNSSVFQSQKKTIWEEAVCLPASTDSSHWMWWTPSRDYSVITSWRGPAGEVTFHQTTIWKEESGVFILCQVHRFVPSVPQANRHLTLESKFVCFRRMAFCLQASPVITFAPAGHFMVIWIHKE